jgi:hypothetical protein
MTGIAIMILNYFHDLAVAMLAANILVIYFLGRYLDRTGIRDQAMTEVFSRLARITYGALAFVIVAGAVRAWFFMDYEWNPAVGQGQVAALIVKHVALVTVTIFGIAAHLRYVRKYGSRS